MSEKTLGQIALEAYMGEVKSPFAPMICWENADESIVRSFEAVAQAVRLATIEECAKIADLYAEKAWAAEDIAKDIRSLAND